MEAMSDRVCAVVVTYNRKDLLRECLKTLLVQTSPLDHIIVVNNASTDGTLDLLAAEFPQLEVLDLPQNSGGAGGFHAGMKWGHEHGFDWVWVMDDDIETVPGALETMLQYRDIGDLIQTRKRQLNGILQWEAIWDVSGCIPVAYKEEVSFQNGREWISISYANFEGALIHRKVMDRIGYPDRRYFMAGDDTIYGFIASLHARAIYINYVGIEKKVNTGQTFSRLHFYLQHRNRFLTYRHLESNGVPVSRKAFWFHMGLTVYRTTALILRNPKQRSRANLAAVFQGVRDGARGKFGRPAWL